MGMKQSLPAKISGGIRRPDSPHENPEHDRPETAPQNSGGQLSNRKNTNAASRGIMKRITDMFHRTKRSVPTVESAGRTWDIPDVPNLYNSNLRHWLEKNEGVIKGASDEQLMQQFWNPQQVREWVAETLKQLWELEEKLAPSEWLARSVWKESKQQGPFNLSELYDMVGPMDEVTVDGQCLNLQSTLGQLVKDTFTVNEYRDRVSGLLRLPNINSASPTPKRVNTLERKIWAIIIGINNYSRSPLNYAVADAQAMSEFLKTKLFVDPANITEMLAPTDDDTTCPNNSKTSLNYPKRQNILDKLWALRRDARIDPGDTIVVFYAGHGTSYITEGSLISNDHVNQSENDPDRSGPFIEGIVPADSDQDDPDKNEPAICDRELNAIFFLTAKQKGPNILFIADCCHSGSVSRNTMSSAWRIRYLDPLGRAQLQDMLERAQQNIVKFYEEDGLSGTSVPDVCSLDWHPDLTSFVTLAACRREETAKEHPTLQHGLFTAVLLDKLKSGPDTTFEGLIAQVVPQIEDWQEPVAYGLRKNMPLWFRKD